MSLEFPPQGLLSVALLRIESVIALTGLSRSEIYRRIANDRFPEPIKLGPRCIRFRAEDIFDWLKTPT